MQNGEAMNLLHDKTYYNTFSSSFTEYQKFSNEILNNFERSYKNDLLHTHF